LRVSRRGFLSATAGCVAAAALPGRPGEEPAQSRPNIVLIMADDMGFSDIGCYGSEIATPNLDRLARGGLRFSRFANNARCCPTRASLLTGLYPHQAGIGHMVEDRSAKMGPAYQGYLNSSCVTIGEALGRAGYRALVTGQMLRRDLPVADARRLALADAKWGPVFRAIHHRLVWDPPRGHQPHADRAAQTGRDTAAMPSACAPGLSRLSCRTDGSFYPCERFRPSATGRIGTAQAGLDLGRVFELRNEHYHLMVERCAACWARPMCQLCFVHAMQDGNWDGRYAERVCTRYRRAVDDLLGRYVSIRDENPTAFDHLPPPGLDEGRL